MDTCVYAPGTTALKLRPPRRTPTRVFDKNRGGLPLDAGPTQYVGGIEQTPSSTCFYAPSSVKGAARLRMVGIATVPEPVHRWDDHNRFSRSPGAIEKISKSARATRSRRTS